MNNKTVVFFAVAFVSVVVRSGTLEQVVVPPSPAPSVAYAAEELAVYVGRLTGRLPVIVTNAVPEKGVFLTIDPQSDDDSFRIKSDNGLAVVSGGKRGVLYGAYELLERFGGVEWLASWHTYVPRIGSFEIPDGLDERQSPAFEAREVYYADVEDHFDFAVRLRLNGLFSHDSNEPHPVDPKFGGKAWRFVKGLKICHTFTYLLPVEKYYKDHPEYYAEVDGVRRDVWWQPCLSNPDVFDIVVSNVLARIAEDPTAEMVGISHNDCADNYCRCAKCAAIDAYEESHAGTELRFVNRVADEVKKRHPKMLVQMLAYQYSRKPPKYERPRDNVVPCFCSIECDRLRPFGGERQHAVNKAFCDELVAWSKMTDKLYVWDYTSEHIHFFYPMPNVPVIQDNIRFFRDHKVRFFFSNGNSGPRHAEFAELKAWLVAKSLWNPDQPLDRLLDRFFNGYYGAAAPFVRRYYELERDQAASVPLDVKVSIYQDDSLVVYPPEFVEKALVLWNQAEKAVSDDPACLYNVRMGKASIVRLALDRLSENVKRIWVTEDPSRFSRPEPRAAEYERFLLGCRAAAAERGVPTQFGNTSRRDSRPQELWRAYVADERPAKGVTKAVLGVDEMDITEDDFARRIDDPTAFDGRAIAIDNPYSVAGVRNRFQNIAFDEGRSYGVRVHVRVAKAPDPRGEALCIRVGGTTVRKDVSEIDENWTWYDFGPFVPQATDAIEIGPGRRTPTGGGRLATESVLVDRIEIFAYNSTDQK